MYNNQILKEDLRKNNITVHVKSCKLYKGFGHQYAINVKRIKSLKKTEKLLGGNRDYLIFRNYATIKNLYHEMVKRGGLVPRRNIPMLGPNPYDSSILQATDHMKLRQELTLKQINDMLNAILDDSQLRNMSVFNNFLKCDVQTSRKVM